MTTDGHLDPRCFKGQHDKCGGRCRPPGRRAVEPCSCACHTAPTVTDAERDAAINEAQRRLGITFGWKVDPDAEAHPDDMTAILEAAARARQGNDR